MTFPEALRTPRLALARMCLADLDDLCRMYRDPVVMATLGGVVSDAVTEERLVWNLDHWGRHGFGWWTARVPDTGVFVGRGGVRRWPVEGRDEVEIGYGLAAEFWGRGLATELAEASVRAGFEILSADSLVSFTLPTNRGSRRVMEKVGFVYERDVVHADLPHVLYRLRREDWLAASGTSFLPGTERSRISSKERRDPPAAHP